MPVIDRSFSSRARTSIVILLLVSSLLLAVSLVTGVLLSFLQVSEGPFQPPQNPPATGRIYYTLHDPIFIYGNGGFTNESGVIWGSGTQSDPYIIAGWEISAYADNGIWIAYTSAYFVIRDCYIHDGYSTYNAGIILMDCSNGILSDNLCIDNSEGIALYESSNNIVGNNNCSSTYGYADYGIILWQSSNNIVTNNSCVGNSDGIYLGWDSNNNTITGNSCLENDYGIYIEQSSNANIISNNNCSSNSDTGIWLEDSNNNTITGNSCSLNYDGINLLGAIDNNVTGNSCRENFNNGIALGWDSKNNTISNNNCSSNSDGCGMYLYDSRNNTITGNSCLENDYGIALVMGSNNNTISNNNCSSNSATGIELFETWGNIIIWNQIFDNLGYGLYIFSYSYNIIYNNTFYHNNGAGDIYDPSHIQAYDDGTNNRWNSSGYGNWWSDWTLPDDDLDGIVDVPYQINGTAGAMDYYPQTTPPIIPEPSILVLISLMMTMFLIVSKKYRRKKT